MDRGRQFCSYVRGRCESPQRAMSNRHDVPHVYCCYYCCCDSAAEVDLVRVVAAIAAVLLLRLVECSKVAGHFLTNKTTRTKIARVHQNSKSCKTFRGVPSDLLVSGRRNAIPCQIEPAQRRLIRRAPPRSLAEIQACFMMYP